MTSTSLFPVRIYYEDTDAGGIVYHASYLRFMERARTEMLRASGLENSALHRDEGILFVVRRIEIDYLAPGRLDDALEVRTEVIAIGGASVTLQQNIWRNDVQLVASRVVLVCIGSDGKALRVPLTAREAFARLSTPVS